MILWKEYQKIKEKTNHFNEGDVKILLQFAWELQITQHQLAEELKKALTQLDALNERVKFYRNIHKLKGVENGSQRN